jgi:CTP synthase
MAKFIFVVGGVYSGTGKGVASASIGFLLKERNLKVQMLKLDPYLNVNAGIIRPSDHGEVYVCDDGSEIDLDAGTYYRIANEETSKDSICTSGTLYKELIFDQENGKYLGQTLQITPHMTEKITSKLLNVEKDNDVVIVEIGGTVGEYQNILFLEAARMMKTKRPDRVFFSVVSYLPIPGKIGEMKTKPTQMAVRTLNASGILPDIIIARASTTLDQKRKEK